VVYNLRYTLENGKIITIPDKEIEKLQKNLELSENEAVKVWLEDNDYELNEEQEQLDKKAKAVKIQHGATAKDKKKSGKPHTVKISDEKKMIFQTILENLDRCELIERENITVLNENKLIQVKVGEKTFKIDLIECRIKKAK